MTTSETSAKKLTERELQVVRLCKEGLLSKEIADTLHISSRTVDNHKSNIFRKLGIRNVLELVRYACEHDI